MYSNLKEKRRYVLQLKIARVEKHRGFFVRNFVKVVFSILGIAVYASFFMDIYQRPEMQKITEGELLKEFLVTSSVCVVYCLLGHFIWGFQDRKKIKRLKKEIEKLEDEI